MQIRYKYIVISIWPSKPASFRNSVASLPPSKTLEIKFLAQCVRCADVCMNVRTDDGSVVEYSLSTYPVHWPAVESV